MLINSIINLSQRFFKPIYEKSFVLQNLDWLIFVNILLVIIFSIFAQSDSIGNFAIFTIILTLVKLLTKSGEKFEPNLADKFLLLYFVFVLISVAGSSLIYLSLKGFLKTVIYLGFYISIVNFLKSNKDKIKYIFITIALCVSYETLVAFLQNAGAVQEISGWQDMSRLNPEEVMTRVYGTLKPYNPNLFGGYMLSAVPVFITLPFINKKFAIFAIPLGLLSVAGIILTGCRGAYIGLFFELFLLAIITYKLLRAEFKKIFASFVGFCTAGLSILILSTSALRARVLSIFAMRSDSSNSFRFNVYNSCVHMFKDNWLLGIGCGNQNFREIYGLYMKTGFDALSAYNIYLETAVESGLFALIAFISFLGAVIHKSVKYVLNKRNTESVFVFSALISLIGMLTHGFVDTVFFRPQIQFLFWTMIGVIKACTRDV